MEWTETPEAVGETPIYLPKGFKEILVDEVSTWDQTKEKGKGYLLRLPKAERQLRKLCVKW